MKTYESILRRSIILLTFVVAISSINVLAEDGSNAAGAEGISSQRLNFELLKGEWLRTDGGYLIRVSDIKTNGQVKAEYFNPKPIHVAEATVSTQKDLMKLFIKLQDKGYQGSTYKLYYYAEKDALVGFYYQAAMDKTFEVIFLRKK